ncbi:hypothetical protein TWF696_009500 [Orbilia brochopaga]|uniref:Uncharacterized protein n=1 Tax=Orbilia brochopaga TaxID=3140254 RepID=A0AAV9UF02_9PEZI
MAPTTPLISLITALVAVISAAPIPSGEKLGYILSPRTNESPDNSVIVLPRVPQPPPSAPIPTVTVVVVPIPPNIPAPASIVGPALPHPPAPISPPPPPPPPSPGYAAAKPPQANTNNGGSKPDTSGPVPHTHPPPDPSDKGSDKSWIIGVVVVAIAAIGGLYWCCCVYPSRKLLANGFTQDGSAAVGPDGTEGPRGRFLDWRYRFLLPAPPPLPPNFQRGARDWPYWHAYI